MYVLFLILFFVSIIGLIVGVISPSTIRLRSRKNALYLFGSMMVIFFILFAIAAPPVQEKQADTNTAINTLAVASTTPQAQAVATTTSTVSDSVVASKSTASSYALGKRTQTSGCTANEALPDSDCTPGAVMTTDTSVICVSGYTQTVRNVPDSVRKQVFIEYGIDYSLHSNYEVDHLIALELGGSNDISNLWPEPYAITEGARTKDKMENYLHSQVCKGAMSIEQAQYEIATNWVKYYSVPTTSSNTTTTTNTTSVSTSQTQGTATTDTSNPPVKKSSTGICHAQGTTYYDRTTNFTPYDSIQACLDSGGRLPK